MDQQISYQDLKKLIDPDFVLFGRSFNPQLKTAHRVQFQDNQLIVHQDQFSTSRFNEIMSLAKDKNSEDQQNEAMHDRLWEEQYMDANYGGEEENADDNGWVTEEEEQNYLQSPMKGVGVLNIQSETQINRKEEPY